MASILAARAARHTSIRRDFPLSDDLIRSVAPSIFATEPHSSRSERYKQIPTVQVLRGLQNNGFQPFMVAQAKTRIPGKQDYTRHLIRLRHADTIKNTEGAHEIILLNSHDGTSSYQMLSGMFRFVCMNGLVCGDVNDEIRVHHKGETVVDDVIEGAFEVIGQTRHNADVIEDMRQSTMSTRQQLALANAAIQLRFGEGNTPITPADALQVRRLEDNGNSEWQVFNRLQENLTRGGMDGKTATGKTRKVREITGMDKDTQYNRLLWQFMQDMREGLAKAA